MPIFRRSLVIGWLVGLSLPLGMTNDRATAQYFGRGTLQSLGREVISNRMRNVQAPTSQRNRSTAPSNNVTTSQSRPTGSQTSVDSKTLVSQDKVGVNLTAPESKNRFALIVATRDYSAAAELPSLGGTNQDADLIARSLRKGGYHDENIIMVYDDADDASFRPTSENIEARFFEFLKKSESGVATIFFIGHGITHGGKSYYCAQNTLSKSLANPNADAPGLISINALANVFSNPKNCGAEHKLIVVDACRNELGDRYEGLVTSLAEIEDAAENVWVMSSCSEGQRSWISESIVPGEHHPVFTYYLAQGLAGAADLLGDHDGQVGLFELFTYAFVKTSEEVEGFGLVRDKLAVQQTPELFGLAAPFELATVDSLVARRTLTTGDVAAEARRSAAQIADDMLVNLRVSESRYRNQITDKTHEWLHQAQVDYLNYLLGNRIRAALEVDPECRLAHTARGITFRASGDYGEALTGFQEAGENFELFVKAEPSRNGWNADRGEDGNVLRNQEGRAVPFLASPGDLEFAKAFPQPGQGEPVDIPRESKITVSAIRDVNSQQWLQFTALNNAPVEPLWIHRDEVHWLPAAVDIYTPSTVMRPIGVGGSDVATRLDYASERIYQIADRLELPSRALYEVAQRLSAPGQRIRQAGANLGEPIRRANAILGPFGISIPNPIQRVANEAAYWADRPAVYTAIAAGKAAIPSNVVRMGGGYVQMPANKIRNIQGWAGHAQQYRSGHTKEVKLEKQRKELKDNGNLGPVEAKTIKIARIPWESPEDAEKEKKDQKSKDS